MITINGYKLPLEVRGTRICDANKEPVAVVQLPAEMPGSIEDKFQAASDLAKIMAAGPRLLAFAQLAARLDSTAKIKDFRATAQSIEMEFAGES